MSPAAKKRKQSAAGGDTPSSSKGKAPAPPPATATAAAADGSDEDSDADRASLDDAEDDLEGLVGEVLNGEIDDADAANGASYSAVDVLRSGFDPIVLEDARGEDACDDGHALAEAGDAEALMRWLVAPADLDDFMRHTWERRAMYVSRNENKNYYAGLLSKDIIDAWLKEGKMRYGVNVDVTSYADGIRRTHNLNDDGSGGVDPATDETGVADAATVWRRFEQEKCSLRVLHPQRWRDALWKQLAAMETFWKCSTGCNAYLTPPDSQGFSPHFDDIDAFVLQLEGKKLWKVYPPRSEREMLPRYSSPNFEQGEIGEPVLEAVLEPGDLLYMPRGTVHQACCVPGAHSLHVTISTNQFNTWADVLELAFPQALQAAVAEVPALRRCPPPDLLDALGVAASAPDSRREALLGVLTELAGAVMRRLPFDDAADQLGRRLMRQRLPPPPPPPLAPLGAQVPVRRARRRVGDGEIGGPTDAGGRRAARLGGRRRRGVPLVRERASIPHGGRRGRGRGGERGRRGRRGTGRVVFRARSRSRAGGFSTRRGRRRRRRRRVCVAAAGGDADDDRQAAGHRGRARRGGVERDERGVA